MDFLATKGIEYLLIIGYLLLLVPLWWLVQRLMIERKPEEAPTPARPRAGWFEVPDGYRYHPGHTWVQDEGGGLFRVGIDDFARRLLGSPVRLQLPTVGDRLWQGATGWAIGIDGHDIDMLSPIDGDVEEVNADAAQNPGLVGDDPFGDGWLLRVRADSSNGMLKNLLPATKASSCMEGMTAWLSSFSEPSLGAVLQDGGVPVSGFARALLGEQWPEFAADLLLTSEGGFEPPEESGTA
jgi:glycine cleavage system H lipoate-binding protein